jgi:hypothetical protein
VVRRTWVFAAFGIAALVCTFIAFYVWFWSYDGRQDIDLLGYVENPDPYMPGAHLATEELCGSELPCIQAVDSDTLTMLRFETQQEAAAAASTFHDARLAGWIVVTFKPGGLSEAERSDFTATLYCVHVRNSPC